MDVKKTLFRLAAVTLSLTITLALGELMVRTYLARNPPGIPDPEVPGRFEYQYEIQRWSKLFTKTLDPDSPLYYKYRGLNTDTETFMEVRYSDGQIRRFDFAKPEGTLRVVCVGDSLTELWKDPGYRNYTHFVGDELAAARPELQVEVIPIGIGGYNTWQEMHLFRDSFAKLEADVLILQMCSNDGDVVELVPRPEGEEETWDDWPDYEVRARGKFRPEDGAFRIGPLHSKLFWYLSRLPFHSRVGTYFHHCTLLETSDQQRTALEWFRGYTAETDKAFLPVLFPIMDDGYSQPGIRYMRELLDGLGIEYLDLLPVLERHDMKSLAMPNDYYHPSPQGHAYAARAIAQRLLERRAWEKGNEAP